MAWARWLWWCWGHCHKMVNTIIFWDNHVFFLPWIPTLNATLTIDYSLFSTSWPPIWSLQLYILRTHVVVLYKLYLPILTKWIYLLLLAITFLIRFFSFVLCSIRTLRQSFAFEFISSVHQVYPFMLLRRTKDTIKKRSMSSRFTDKVSCVIMQSISYEGNQITSSKKICFKFKKELDSLSTNCICYQLMSMIFP